MSQPTPSAVAAPLTRILLDDLERADDAARALARLGFVIRREPGRLVAESDRVEAQEARRWLRALGFHDGGPRPAAATPGLP